MNWNGLVGGPGRDRTDDLFHAMEWLEPQIIDGTALRNRQNRQKRPTGRYLRAKCGQNLTKWPVGWLCGTSPSNSPHEAFLQLHSVRVRR
jgi:hypothetical protein